MKTYHDVYYEAEKPLEPGEEIFVEYGEWLIFKERLLRSYFSHPSTAGDNYFSQRDDLEFVPLSTDFKRADRFMSSFMSFVGRDIRSEMAKDLFDVMLTAYEKSNTRLSHALPKSLDDVEVAAKKGTADMTVPDKIRSKEWLKENGMCIDNIMPARARIIQAGRGAFATRKIKKGAVISPVPVVQILREHLELYDSDNLQNPSEVWSVSAPGEYVHVGGREKESLNSRCSDYTGRKSDLSELLPRPSREQSIAFPLRTGH